VGDGLSTNSAPELNSQEGKVLRYDGLAERYVVELEGGAHKSIRPINLRVKERAREAEDLRVCRQCGVAPARATARYCDDCGACLGSVPHRDRDRAAAEEWAAVSLIGVVEERHAKDEMEEGGEEDEPHDGIVTHVKKEARRRGGRSRSRYNKRDPLEILERSCKVLFYVFSAVHK
jgi:hypothetical protein